MGNVLNDVERCRGDHERARVLSAHARCDSTDMFSQHSIHTRLKC